MPLLVMRDIDKRFQGAQALAKASLEVAPAEIMALVGQNGAGKSTLIKVLTGAYSRDAGEIAFDGQPVALRLAAGGPKRRHQHDLSGDQPVPFRIGGGEHLSRARTAPLRLSRLAAHA